MTRELEEREQLRRITQAQMERARAVLCTRITTIVRPALERKKREQRRPRLVVKHSGLGGKWEPPKPASDEA